MKTKHIIYIVVIVLVFFALGMIGVPYYTVWSQEMDGKAEFAKAEQNRKIKIEEARLILKPKNLMLKQKLNEQKVQQKLLKLKMVQ
jgi:Flp pilus assembly protein CpaB